MIRRWLIRIFAEILKEAEKYNNPPKPAKTIRESQEELLKHFPMHLKTVRLKVVKVEGDAVVIDCADRSVKGFPRTVPVGNSIELNWRLDGIE